MQIEITGHHLDITDALRAHVGRRLARINGLQAPRHLHAVLNVDKKRHICDLMTRLEGEEFVARGEDDDMYAAIDRAAEKMERQLQSAKGRKTPRRGR
ncbi:MAG: ribosome hibernation-promoting factor, HPF/YfiA family [Gammaproteobacteria bacterium]